MTEQTSQSPSPRINVQSLNRFLRLFDTATNIMNRQPDNPTVTFVLLFVATTPAPDYTHASLYAIRTFRGADAAMVNIMLDPIYHGDGDAPSWPTGEPPDRQRRIEEQLSARWSALINARGLRFPRVYTLFVDPAAYRLSASTTVERNAATSANVIAAHDDNHDDNYFNGDDDHYSREEMRRGWDPTADVLRTLADNEETSPLDDPTTDRYDADGMGRRLFATSTLNDAARTNHVDNEGLLDRLSAVDTWSPRELWQQVHEHVDRVLFSRGRLDRQPYSLLVDASRRWTLPVLRHAINRKINQVLLSAGNRRRQQQQDDRSCFLDATDRESCASYLAKEPLCRDDNTQYRSRDGMHVVLPGEWIETSLISGCESNNCESGGGGGGGADGNLGYDCSTRASRSIDPRQRWYAKPDAGFNELILSATAVDTVKHFRENTREEVTVNSRKRKQALAARGNDALKRLLIGSGVLIQSPPTAPSSAKQACTPGAGNSIIRNLLGMIAPGSSSSSSISSVSAETVNTSTSSSLPPTASSLARLLLACNRTTPTAPIVPMQTTDNHYFKCGDQYYGRRVPTTAATSQRAVAGIANVHRHDDNSDDSMPSRWIVFRSKGAKAPRRPTFLGSTLLTKDPAINNTTSHTMVNTFPHWEQGILRELAVEFLDGSHAINVNGDAGTGKSTVMQSILSSYRRPLLCVPTNKMRFYLRERLATLGAQLPCVSVATATLSACVKRLARFATSPQAYSKYLERRFVDSLDRVSDIVRRNGACINQELVDVSLPKVAAKKPVGEERDGVFLTDEPTPLDSPNTHRKPDILMLDESNMCLWQQVAVTAHGARELGVPVMLFGDSSQNRPIRAAADNAELVAFAAGDLSVQLLANKRLRADDENTPLACVLRDNVWRLSVDEENNRSVARTIGIYVRDLIARQLGPQSLLDEARHCIDVTLAADEWCDSIVRLHQHYRRRPCDRYEQAATSTDWLERITRLVPRPVHPFLIAQTNVACDRFNVLYANAFAARLAERLRELNETRLFLMYALRYRRTCFLPSRALPLLPDEQLRCDEYTSLCPSSANVPTVGGTVLDDPWCSEVVLCVGFTYEYLGSSPLIPPGSTMRLLQMHLPEEMWPEFRCNWRTERCQRCCTTPIARNNRNNSSNNNNNNNNGQRYDSNRKHIGGLVMQSIEQPSLVYLVRPEYYELNRYNSLWSSNDEQARPCPRNGARIYGFPLRLHASRTCYKVQGETLSYDRYPEVHVDLANMGRQSAMVSLSRVTEARQLRSILNVPLCCNDDTGKGNGGWR